MTKLTTANLGTALDHFGPATLYLIIHPDDADAAITAAMPLWASHHQIIEVQSDPNQQPGQWHLGTESLATLQDKTP